MRTFLHKILKYLIFASAFIFIIFILIIYVNIATVKNNRIKKDIHAVILGDSHAMWSINDSIIPGLRNVSLNAEGYYYNYLKLKDIIKTNPQIKTLYLSFSYHNLSGYYDDYLYGYKSNLFIDRYIDLLGITDYMKLSYRNPKNIKELFPIICREGVYSLFDGECAYIGSFPKEKMMDIYNPEKMKNRINEQYYNGDKLFPPSKFNIEYLNKIIMLCKEHNINLIVFKTPLQKDYFNQIPDIYISMYEEFVKKYNLNKFDFENISLPDSCFLPDGDHVNYNGSIIVTEVFKRYFESSNSN